jgi:signal transduction histidine kinase
MPGGRPGRRRRDAGLLLALAAALAWDSRAAAADLDAPKLVVALYPNESDGAPGIIQVNRALHSVFGTESPFRIELRNEYVDTSRLRDAEFRRAQVSLLQRKYAGRKVDLVVVGLSSALDFALKYRDEVFPGVPIVFAAVDQREVAARRLPPDVVGVPIRMDLAGTLDLALRLHPDARRVYVVAGAAPFDLEWEAEARRAFRPYDGRVEFVYLTGLPMDDLLGRVAALPEQSLIYYLHVHQDGSGIPCFPAAVLERVAANANAPVYGHVNTYVGRGAVGGHVFTFESAGLSAARLGLRILAGEKPEAMPAPGAMENSYHFDSRQLRRWGIDEGDLPPGSVVLGRETSVWDGYKWHILGVASLLLLESLLIAALVIQRLRRYRAENGLLASQRELRQLTGRLLEAQEGERRRIARELHDDLNQSLALLAVELDVLGRKPPALDAGLAGRLAEIAARVKDLSTAVHDLSHELHPSKLEHLGLVAAVGGLCRDVALSHELEVEFTHAADLGELPADVTLCLYRIVQETLRNVVKHSGSRRAAVDLSGTADAVRLRVADDGVGFAPGAVVAAGGLGLVSMRERLYMVGGLLTIDSRPGGGTRIEVRVPTAVGDPTADLAAVPTRPER